MSNSFLHQLQEKRNDILLNKNTVRQSSLNYIERTNIYNELDNIYSNDWYPKVDTISTQTDPISTDINENGSKLPLCSFFLGSTLITLTLITMNNFLLYYFTNIDLN